MSRRETYASAYPSEEVYGYVRAVRVDRHVYVSGTTARNEDLALDAGGQMRAALALVQAALRELGAEFADVVRTVVYLRDLEAYDAVAEAHRAAFGAAPPASTVVEVARLSPENALVEIEVTAHLAET